MRITNNLGLPQPLVSAVERDHTYKPKQYSVTALLKGTCQSILERRHDDEIEQDVSEMAWLIFGSAVHKVIEEAQETIHQIKETKMVIDLPNGYKLSGIQDLYDDNTKTVTDWKTASVNKVLFADWEDYRTQTLIYCWMLRQIGFDAKRGEVVALLKDHNKGKSLQGGNYPPHPIYKIGWTFADKDFVESKDFIMNKFEDIAICEQMNDEDLPACSAKERWHKDDTFAIMKEGRKSAVRVLNSQEEAELYIINNVLDSKHSIVKREGEDTKCEKYCNVNKWCPYYQRKEQEVF